MKDLMTFVEQCRKDLDALGIQYGTVLKWEINTRAKRRWGQCKMIAKGQFSVSISERLLDNRIDDQALKDTIVHELLHTVPGCMNHTGKWKQLADKVNGSFPGYCIKRTSSEEEKGIEALSTAPAYRYILKCQKCGKMAFRQRLSSFVTHPEKYQCVACGGAFQRVR